MFPGQSQISKGITVLCKPLSVRFTGYPAFVNVLVWLFYNSHRWLDVECLFGG